MTWPPRRSSLLGRAVRLPLRAVPRNLAVPMWGPGMRGMRWIVGAGTHGPWIGTFEVEQADLFRLHVKPGMTVYDVGAHAGFYSLLASRLVGPTGAVIAFEPLPRNLGYLRRHVAINNLTNVTVVDQALAREAGESRLSTVGDSHLARIDALGTIPIQVTSLDDVAFGPLGAPDVVKIDVEGAEVLVLGGGLRVLREVRPTIFLALHSADLAEECTRILTEEGYRIRPIGGPDHDQVLAQPRAVMVR